MTRHPSTLAIIQHLRSLGWKPVRTKGSHQTWRSPAGRTLTLVVNHLSRPASAVVLAAYRRAVRGEDA